MRPKLMSLRTKGDCYKVAPSNKMDPAVASPSCELVREDYEHHRGPDSWLPTKGKHRGRAPDKCQLRIHPFLAGGLGQAAWPL